MFLPKLRLTETTIVTDTGNGSGVFTHMMPFLLYSIPHSCGPDRHVCCKFDFHQKQCFYGKKKMDKLVITDENVANVYVRKDISKLFLHTVEPRIRTAERTKRRWSVRTGSLRLQTKQTCNILTRKTAVFMDRCDFEYWRSIAEGGLCLFLWILV